MRGGLEMSENDIEEREADWKDDEGILVSEKQGFSFLFFKSYR